MDCLQICFVFRFLFCVFNQKTHSIYWLNDSFFCGYLYDCLQSESQYFLLIGCDINIIYRDCSLLYKDCFSYSTEKSILWMYSSIETLHIPINRNLYFNISIIFFWQRTRIKQTIITTYSANGPMKTERNWNKRAVCCHTFQTCVLVLQKVCSVNTETCIPFHQICLKKSENCKDYSKY